MKNLKELGVDPRLIGILALGVVFVLSKGFAKLLGVHLIAGFFATVTSVFLVILVWLFLLKDPIRPKDDPDGLNLGFYDSPMPGFSKDPVIFQPSKFRHILVTGTTGFGKSTFIRRMIDEILATGKRFLYVDFKGEERDHREILKICEKRGISKELQIFDLSDPSKCLSCNPLTIFSDVEETVGFIIGLFFDDRANEYYRNEAERFLRFAIHLLDASGTKRTFVHINDIFYHQTSRTALLNQARKRVSSSEPFFLYFESEFNQLAERERSERYSGFISLLSSFTSEPLRRVFNGEEKNELRLGALFEENIPTIIRVPGEAYGKLSVRIIQSFINSIPVLLAQRRQKEHRPDYFVLLDEGCSYVSETLGDLLKKAGSAGVKILLTRMSDADFDSVAPAFRGKMLSAFSVFVCFHTTDPDTRETMSRLAMTEEDIKLTKKIGMTGETGEGSQRDVQRFTIHPSSFGRLKPGECYVISPALNIFRKAQIFPARSLL